MQLDARNTSTWPEVLGAHDLTLIVAIFLVRPSADLSQEYLSLHSLLHHTIVFALARRTPVGLPQFPDVPALTAQLSRYATSFARLGFNCCTLILLLFEDAVRVRASGKICRVANEFGRKYGDWQDCCWNNVGGLALFAGTIASSVRPYRRWSYIPNRNACQCALREIKCAAALLDALASMIGASLAKASSVLFEWVGASVQRWRHGEV